MRPTHTAPALALLVLLLASVPADAQVLLGYLFGEKLASPTFNMGFEVGANFTNFDGFTDPQRSNRPVFGLFADWRFSEHFHFGAAVLPIASRGADQLAPVATGDPDFDAQTGSGTMNRSLNYVEVPLLLKWAPHRDDGFRAGIGPSLGIVTSANDRYQVVSPTGTAYVLERDIGGLLPDLDMGISFDAEWRIKLLSIAVRYTHGLTDMSHAGSADPVYSRVLTGTGRISLGKKPAS